MKACYILQNGLQFSSKADSESFHFCVCYLPPIESTRDIDANEFFDTLLYQVHMYYKNSVFVLCGDYNSRCSNLDDNIPGVDKFVERDTVDFTLNKYGEVFCDFLIDSNCCILNGRNFISNNFTYTGPNGSSVVDYCWVPFEYLTNFSV